MLAFPSTVSQSLLPVTCFVAFQQHWQGGAHKDFFHDPVSPSNLVWHVITLFCCVNTDKLRSLINKHMFLILYLPKSKHGEMEHMENLLPSLPKMSWTLCGYIRMNSPPKHLLLSFVFSHLSLFLLDYVSRPGAQVPAWIPGLQ